MQTATTTRISAKIKKEMPRVNTSPGYLICNDPTKPDETYIRKFESFTLRMSDLTIVEGTASSEEVEEAQDWYRTYMSIKLDHKEDKQNSVIAVKAAIGIYEM